MNTDDVIALLELNALHCLAKKSDMEPTRDISATEEKKMQKVDFLKYSKLFERCKV